MPYSISNPPQLISQGIGGGIKTYSYSSVDPVGDVDATGYFTNGVALGMALGDAVNVYESDANLETKCFVSAVNASTGVVTVTESTN